MQEKPTSKSCFGWAGPKVSSSIVCARDDQRAARSPALCDCWELPQKVVPAAQLVGNEISLMSRCTDALQGAGSSDSEP